MRYIAKTKENQSEAVRVMVHDTGEGTYVYTFTKHEDSDSDSDYWYENVEDVLEFCEEHFGISREAWEEIPDPSEGCQHDWIEPVRLSIKNQNGYQVRKYEVLVKGVWVELCKR